ncbi:hypothetical protein [Aquamicrobium defluvii]|nr:hypothetical protein [Aquamicrobium defluvii]
MVQATYTPTVLYQNLTCEQLVREGWTVSNRAHAAAGKQNRHRVEDEVAITAGVLVFWPALFFTHGNDATTAEFAQLKGEMQAIEAASQAKNCGIVFNRA